MKRMFFSGEVQPDGPLDRFCKSQSVELNARSLLEFAPVPFSISQPFDVVFFSSIRSYNYFISGISGLPALELACLGSQTAGKINHESSSMSFVGSGAGNPEAVAQEFRKWLDDRRVLFPVSRQSAGTIANAIPDHQKEVVICYETLLAGINVGLHDIYVFTSPSNVEAFLLKNVFPSSAIAIAWGKTTEKKLVEKGIYPGFILKESTEEELVEIVSPLILPLSPL